MLTMWNGQRGEQDISPSSTRAFYNKARQAQLYYGIWQKMNTTEAWKAMHDWNDVAIESYDEWESLRKDPEMRDSWSVNLSTFEGISIFARARD